MKIIIKKLYRVICFCLKILKCPLITILLLFVFFALPIGLEKVILCLREKQILSIDVESNYIQFYGTVLSGLFTLIGVKMTIKYEGKTKKEEDLIMYKPILSVDGINSSENCKLREVGLSMGFSASTDDPEREIKQENFFKKLKESNIKYRLIIKNKGRAETFNTVIESFELDSVNWEDKINLCSNHSNNQYVGEILKEEYLGIDINLPGYLFMPEKMQDILWYELRTNISITYSDMFNKIKYQYIVHMIYKVIIDEYQTEQPYLYKDKFKFAKVHYEIEAIMPEMRIYSDKMKKYIHEQEYIREKYKK